MLEENYCKKAVNPLPNDKILEKALADDKIILIRKLKFVLGIVKNVVGEENAGYQHFLLFPQCFQNLSFPKVLKVRIVW